MATPVAEVVKVNWKQLFPWLALFRTLGLALHVRQVFVGVVAAGLIALMQTLLVQSPFPRPGISDVPLLPVELLGSAWVPVFDQIWPVVMRNGEQGHQWNGSTAASGWQIAMLLITMAWGLVVGGLAGGILVRRAAFEFAREETLSLTAATRFVGRRAVDYLSAPALPLSAALGLGMFLILTGCLLQWLPGGGHVVSAMWGLVYFCGIAMAVLLLVILAAWPMMIAAVSINGGDGFDALSRGIGFVIDRWRYYAWCVLVMSVYGGVCALLLGVAQQSGNSLIQSSLIQGSGRMPAEGLGLPQLLPPGGWETCLNLIGSGLSYSFFWSAMTITYLVLRKSVDNAELNDIYIEGESSMSDNLQTLLNPQIPTTPTLLPIIDPPPTGQAKPVE